MPISADPMVRNLVARGIALPTKLNPLFRICNKCKIKKKMMEFPRNPSLYMGGFGYQCKECRRKYNYEYNKSGRKKAWRERNAEKISEQNKIRRKKKYRSDPSVKEKKLICNRNRKARLKNAFVESIDHQIVYKRDNFICQLCQQKIVDPSELSIDHIQPIARGGLHEYKNVQTAHKLCNSRKGARV